MKRFVIPALLLAPMMVFAQDGGLTNIQTLLEAFGTLVETALPIAVGIALLALFWGLALFIFAAGDANKKDKGVHLMIWSVVALFVMVSIWGLVAWLGDALDITQDETITVPDVPGLGDGV